MHPQNGISGMRQNDFVAQLVEQLTLNQWAEGSSPSEVTQNKPLTKVGGFLFDWIYLLFTMKYYHAVQLITKNKYVMYTTGS